MRAMTATTAMLSLALAAQAQAQISARPGDIYEIRIAKETSQKSSDGSSGSSTDRDTMIERIIAARDGGLEVEYDLPRSATAQDRARNWQFPARIFKPAKGPPQLLNQSEMEKRVDRWLKAGKMTRAACGHWIFTWNAFRIECDPLSVIPSLSRLEVWPDDLREGAEYLEPGANGPASRVKAQSGSTDIGYVVETVVDPVAVRRQRAESDVIVAEIMRKPLTLESALSARSAEAISGTIKITFDGNAAGSIQRRTKVTNLEIKGPGERVENQTVTEVVEKKLISLTK